METAVAADWPAGNAAGAVCVTRLGAFPRASSCAPKSSSSTANVCRYALSRASAPCDHRRRGDSTRPPRSSIFSHRSLGELAGSAGGSISRIGAGGGDDPRRGRESTRARPRHRASASRSMSRAMRASSSARSARPRLFCTPPRRCMAASARSPHDVVIAISNSGNTSELWRRPRAMKEHGAQLIADDRQRAVGLAQIADLVMHAPVRQGRRRAGAGAAHQRARPDVRTGGFVGGAGSGARADARRV